jgi:O-antigen/teichoic acid export membrane protein
MSTPSPGTTERRFLSSVLAAYGSQFGRTLVRLVPEIILARLILPADHGLFDRALAIVILTGFCRDLGVTYQVVRDPRQPYGSALLWVLSSGAVLSAGLLLGAPLFAGWDPRLPTVLGVMSLHVLLDGLSVVPRVYFERQLQVKRLVVPEILRGLTFALVSITLAATHLGVWSFVAGELAATATFGLLLWQRARGEIPLQVRPALIPELISRSFLLFLIVWCFYSVPFVGRFVIADSEMVGHYTKAYRWALLLQALIVPSFARVFYPALVEYRNQRQRFVTAYRLGTVSILSLETLGAYFLFFNAEVVLVDILLGSAWRPAVPLVRILCFLPLVEPFNRLGGEVLKALEEDRIWLTVAVVNLVCLILFGIGLTSRLGPAGMAWAHYLQLGNLLMMWRLYRVAGSQFTLLLRQILVVYLVPLPFFLAAAGLFPAASWPRFAASLLAAAAAAGILAWHFSTPLRQFFAAEGAGGEPHRGIARSLR